MFCQFSVAERMPQQTCFSPLPLFSGWKDATASSNTLGEVGGVRFFLGPDNLAYRNHAKHFFQHGRNAVKILNIEVGTIVNTKQCFFSGGLGVQGCHGMERAKLEQRSTSPQPTELWSPHVSKSSTCTGAGRSCC